MKEGLLSKQIEDRAGQAINVTDWSMCNSFDVMSEVGFNMDFGNLAFGVEHSAIKPIHEHIKIDIKIVGTLSPIPWLMTNFVFIPGAANNYLEIFSFCAQ